MDRREKTVLGIELTGLGVTVVLPWIGIPLMAVGLAVLFWPKTWPLAKLLETKKSAPQSNELAFVQYEALGSSFKVTHSSNVASITDNGVADVTVIFENSVPASYTVDIRSDRSLQWHAVERTEKHCRIKFEGEEPKFVRIGFLSPTLEDVRTDLSALEHKAATADIYLELARRSGETAESLSKILADFAGARKSAENENVSQSRFDELEKSVLDIGQRMAQLSTIPAPASLGGQLLIEKLGQNVFRVWLKVPMAKVPALTFTELPEGVSGRIIDATKTSFIVEFTPKSLPVESFGFFANARLS